MAGGAGRTSFHGAASNARHGYVGRKDGFDARHAYAGADGSTADGQGRRVRPLIFDRDDSASQWRVDNGEGFVRHRGRGAGCRSVQLRDRCGQYATGRDQDYADYARKKIVRGETMNRTPMVAFRVA